MWGQLTPKSSAILDAPLNDQNIRLMSYIYIFKAKYVYLFSFFLF